MQETTRQAIVRKLTSRKLWIAVAAFVTAIMLHHGTDAGSVESIATIVMAFASALAYIVGEGLVDAQSASVEVLAEIVESDIAK